MTEYELTKKEKLVTLVIALIVIGFIIVVAINITKSDCENTINKCSEYESYGYVVKANPLGDEPFLKDYCTCDIMMEDGRFISAYEFEESRVSIYEPYRGEVND